MKSQYITEALALAQDFIAVESTKENMGGLQDVLTIAQKALLGFTIETFSDHSVPSLIAYAGTVRPKKFSVILNAHLDVVPGTHGQYKAKIVGDKLFGRGAYDMKAAAAVELVVFRGLADQLKYPIGLQLVTDEEVGGHHGTLYQVKQGVESDCVLVGETSSDLTIGIQSKGIMWTKVTFQGKSAHGAYPWKGDNALWKVHKFLGAIASAFPVPAKAVWETTVNVASIQTSNTTFNKIPDKAYVLLDIRYIPSDKTQVKKKLAQCVGDDGSMEFVTEEPSHETPKDNPYVVSLVKAASHVMGKTCQVAQKHGASDLRHFPKSAGLEFGPVGGGPHTDEEWVSISGLATYASILKEFLTTQPNR